jgi:hypothetical protein
MESKENVAGSDEISQQMISKSMTSFSEVNPNIAVLQ